MGLVIVTTFGLICWIVLWAIGSRSIDPFVATIFVLLLGSAGRMLGSHLPGRE